MVKSIMGGRAKLDRLEIIKMRPHIHGIRNIRLRSFSVFGLAYLSGVVSFYCAFNISLSHTFLSITFYSFLFRAETYMIHACVSAFKVKEV